VPLINKDKVNDTIKSALNAVSAKLDTKALQELNTALDAPDKPEYADVAKDWLSKAGL
jgi:osmoprotectant transport system substrate-binding protein